MVQITVLNQSNVPQGPFTREQVGKKLSRGEISLESLAHMEGLTEWTPLDQVLAQVDATPLPPLSALSIPVPAYSYAATMEPPPHLVYAGFWIRFGAHVLDNLIVSVPFVFIWFLIVFVFLGLNAFGALPQAHGGRVDPVEAIAWFGTVAVLYLTLIVGRLIAVWLYHALLESGPHQATWGKRILGLKVTGVSGERISFAHASGRFFSTLITGMTMGIGYLMVAFTERKQALHDMIAGTLVVRR